MTASPFTAPWLSASPTHPWRWSSRRAQPPRRARPRAPRPSAGSAHPDDPGQGAPGLAEGGRLRPAFAWGDRHVPLQSCHRSRPARPDTAGPEDRSPGRLLGAQPDDPARYAAVAAHRLKARPTDRSVPTTRIAHQSRVGTLANVGVVAYVFRAEQQWWVSGIAGVIVGSISNYAISSTFTWKK